MPINGIALTAVSVGSIFLWSGVKGWNVSTTMAEIISGKTPSGTNQNILTASNSASSGVIGTTSSGLANDAEKYQGHAYQFGGSPGANGDKPWDCSSFMNWVIGHDARRSIPGYANGSYDGTVHGPPTGSWLIWPGMQHISRSELQAGDLIVWVTHMGMAISNSQMISALNSKLGTRISGIDGIAPGPPIFGRLK